MRAVVEDVEGDSPSHPDAHYDSEEDEDLDDDEAYTSANSYDRTSPQLEELVRKESLRLMMDDVGDSLDDDDGDDVRYNNNFVYNQHRVMPKRPRSNGRLTPATNAIEDADVAKSNAVLLGKD